MHKSLENLRWTEKHERGDQNGLMHGKFEKKFPSGLLQLPSKKSQDLEGLEWEKEKRW